MVGPPMLFAKKMSLGRVIEAAGVSMVLISLLGPPWYLITVHVTPDTSYTFAYSPFARGITLGPSYTELEWFYRIDTTLVGTFCGAAAVISQVVPKSRRLHVLLPATILLIVLLFPSFLPMHLATATRLSFGSGIFVAGIGALLMWFSKILSAMIVGVSRFL